MTTEPVVPAAPAAPVDVARLEALEAQATSGPWRRSFSDAQKADHIRSGAGMWVAQFAATEVDAEFIAALRNAAPSLLAAYRERDELRAAVERVEAALANADRYRITGDDAVAQNYNVGLDTALGYIRAALGGETDG